MGETRHPHPQQTAAKILEREQRNNRIIQLKRSGLSHQEIAREVGCNPDTVTQVHREWIAEVREATFTDTALYVAEALDRYGALLSAMWPAAMAGSEKAVAECRRLVGAITDLTVPKDPIRVELQESDVDRSIRELTARLSGGSVAPAVQAAAVEGT